jgi:hypothetical protein
VNETFNYGVKNMKDILLSFREYLLRIIPEFKSHLKYRRPKEITLGQIYFDPNSNQDVRVEYTIIKSNRKKWKEIKDIDTFMSLVQYTNYSPYKPRLPDAGCISTDIYSRY